VSTGFIHHHQVHGWRKSITESTTESTTRSCHHVSRRMLFSVRRCSWRIDTIRDLGYPVFCDRIGKVSVIISSAGSATTGIALTEMPTLGHVHSSSLMLRLASHHLAVFRSCPVGAMHPCLISILQYQRLHRHART
jgi:hypothetical protein